MKHFLIALLAFTLVGLPTAHAASVAALPVHLDCSMNGGSATQSTRWTTLVNSTPKSVAMISVANSSSVGIYIGVGASSAEVKQLIIAPYGSLAVIYPIQVSQAQKIAIQPNGSTGTGCAMDFNIIYR